MEAADLADREVSPREKLDPPMPRIVGVAGALLIGYGVFGAIDLLLSVSSGETNFNLAVLFMPLGFTLLAGRPKARDWAAFGFGAVAVLAAISLVMALLSPWVPSIRVSPSDFVATILSLCLFPACGYIAYRLAQSEVYQWFQVFRTRPAAPHSWRWAIAAACVLLVLPSQFLSHKREQQLKHAFQISTAITAVDASTGLEIGGHLYLRDWSETFVNGKSAQIIPVTWSLSANNGICRLGFKGVSAEPLRFKIGADDHADTEVVIDRDTPPELRVRMKRANSPEATSK